MEYNIGNSIINLLKSKVFNLSEKLICCVLIILNQLTCEAKIALQPYQESAPLVLTVCGSGCSASTIKEGIRLSKPNGILHIKAGQYFEHRLTIEKPISIVGEGWPEIDGLGKGDVFIITSSGVRLTGLVVKNSGFSSMDDRAAIKVSDSTNCVISNNRLYDNSFGIFLGKSQNCLIEDNTIKGANHSDYTSGNGIHLWNVAGSVIRGNDISFHRDGIYFEFVKNCRLENNISSKNFRYGLHFMYSDNNSYKANTFARNLAGVAVMYSKKIQMDGNLFLYSTGNATYGMLLKEISDSEILNNEFGHNTVGAYLEGVTRSQLRGNRFDDNGWAVRLLGSSESNIITHNQFAGNTFDLSTNAGEIKNKIDENYWDRYFGIDWDNDGFGDLAFRPVKLSSALMERFGVSVLLLKSFFFTVADEVENVIPVLTPVELQDNRPLMKPPKEEVG